MRVLWCLLIFLGMVSCDIPGNLTIVNRTGERVLYQYTEVQENGDVEVIDIELNGVKRKGVVLFGFGQWWTE